MRGDALAIPSHFVVDEMDGSSMGKHRAKETQEKTISYIVQL